MVVMTAKVSKAKIIAVVCLLAIVICAALMVLKGCGADGADAAAIDISTNEGRVAFLGTYGWEVNETPVETQEVRIPEEMNEVFEKYNELQRSQGFDLSDFAGRQVKRYVYEVTNYSGADAPVYATLLVFRDAVIGGDITSTAGAGLMHGFAAPAGSQRAAGQSAAPAAEAEPETPSAGDEAQPDATGKPSA